MQIMSEPTRNGRRGITSVLAVCVIAGLAYLGIGLATDQARFGVIGLLIMLAYGAVLLIGRSRSEGVALLAGEVTDERREQLMLRSLAFTANVLVTVLVVGFLVTLAMESDLATVFAALSAVGALTFVVGICWNLARR
jgi:hypothetical protein